MKVVVVGTGYVGLVTGTCFAEMGNDVVCVDIDKAKVKSLKQGLVPIFEPGLEEAIKRNVNEKRLNFTDDLKTALPAQVIFLALPTPPGEDGSADLSYILGVADDLGRQIKQYSVVVDKSTVPVGTAQLVKDRIAKKATTEFDVVSNPEFLREGQAVKDFLEPERVVIGSSSKRAIQVMTELYQPFLRDDPKRLIVTDEASAEMIKYAANAFLATKISFINQIAGLCSIVGADVDMVRRGVGSDSRIGSQFLYAGLGYGGSCFPKDVLALSETAKKQGYDFGILTAVMQANDRQKRVIPEAVLSYYEGDVSGKVFALWGLAFKDNTDDIRESPALNIIDALTKAGARIVAFDPQAIPNTRRRIGANKLLEFSDDEYAALQGADALIIATNWREFLSPDFKKMKQLLKAPVIFDGRNLYKIESMKQEGFNYTSVGRQTVTSHD